MEVGCLGFMGLGAIVNIRLFLEAPDAWARIGPVIVMLIMFVSSFVYVYVSLRAPKSTPSESTRVKKVSDISSPTRSVRHFLRGWWASLREALLGPGPLRPGMELTLDVKEASGVVIGTRRYHIERRLGEDGGFAQVWKARDMASGEIRAVKVFRAQ